MPLWPPREQVIWVDRREAGFDGRSPVPQGVEMSGGDKDRTAPPVQVLYRRGVDRPRRRFHDYESMSKFRDVATGTEFRTAFPRSE